VTGHYLTLAHTRNPLNSAFPERVRDGEHLLVEQYGVWAEARALLTQALETRRSLTAPRPDSAGTGRTFRRLAAVELRCAEQLKVRK
jgi:hypothetical protein